MQNSDPPTPVLPIVHLMLSRRPASKLALPLLSVPANHATRCQEFISGVANQLGLPRVTEQQRRLLLPLSKNPHLDALTRANAKALSGDAQVAQACGVKADDLQLLADQRVEVQILGDALANLQAGADQHVRVCDAAQKELTDALYAYYDSQIESGRLTAQEKKDLTDAFDELLALREKKQVKQTKHPNATACPPAQ